MVLFTMFFGGGMIPTYLLVKDLKLLNTVWSLVRRESTNAPVIVKARLMQVPSTV